MLLVLDNCEHLLHACAELATQLLQRGRAAQDPRDEPRAAAHRRRDDAIRCRRSRCPMRAAKLVAATRCTQFEAVRLFIDRAIAAQPVVRR